MKWVHENWEIQKLLRLHDEGHLNLTPGYQRNPIWTSKSQRDLIETILTPRPMPTFFLLKKPRHRYEMVDGQQRTRSMIDFVKGHITSSAGVRFDASAPSDFMEYELSITLITHLAPGESIEKFYALVNRTGLRMNVPELRKAEYYSTRFLSLCTELASAKEFVKLGLFGPTAIGRMNDVELVSELLTLLYRGLSDKKEEVERVYQEDVTEEQAIDLRKKFNRVVKTLTRFDRIRQLKETRFRQRADLYTLFDFIWSNREMKAKGFASCYRILLAIERHISPSQMDCDPLRDYARNCVSQSHSKIARRDRSRFYSDLMRNPRKMPNGTQRQVIRFLGLGKRLIEIEGAWAIDIARAKGEL